MAGTSDFIPDDNFVPDKGSAHANFVPDESFQADEDKYGTPGQMAKTFAEHALNTATFGASTKAEVGLGVAKPKDIKGRTEENKVTGVLGDVAGIGGSLLVPGVGEAAALEAPSAIAREAKLALEAAQEAHGIEGSTETANAVIEARKALLGANDGLNTAKNTFRAGDLLNPVQATSKIGKNVSSKAADLLGVSSEVGSGASKVLNYAKSIGATALGSSVEGALYNGLGGSLTEDALGDNKNLNGEQILSHIMGNFGTGWLLGGAIGGATHLAGVAIPESVGAIRDSITGLKNAVLGTGEADAGLVGAMLPRDESSLGKFSDALKNRTLNLSPEDKQSVAKEIASNLQRIDNNIKTATSDIYDGVDSEASKAKINGVDQAPVLSAVQGHINALDMAVKEMRTKPNIWNQGVADSIDAINDGLKEIVTKPGDITNSDIVDELRVAKKGLQKLQPKAFRAGDIGGSSDTVKGLYQGINKDIKNPDIVGDVGARLSSADDVVSTRKSFFQPSSDPDFELKRKDFVKSFFSKGKGPGSYIWDPTKMAKTLGAADSISKNNALEVLEQYYDYQRKIPQHLEDFVQNVPNENMPKSQLSNMIDKSQMSTADAFEKYNSDAQKANKSGLLDKLATFGIASGHPHIGVAAEALDFGLNPISKVQKLAYLEKQIGEVTNLVGKGVKSIFTKSLSSTKPFLGAAVRNTASRMEDHEDDASKFLAMSNDIMQMSHTLSENTKDMESVAPGHALSVQQAGARATQFLASKLPMQPSSNPLEPKYEPSSTEMAKFNRYKSVVEKPTLALQEIKDGTITPETVETLNSVYPQLYGQMKQMIGTEAGLRAKEGALLSPSRKLAISMFMGSPINNNYSPQSVAQNQAVFMAHTQAQAQGQPKASKTGMGKIKMAGRFSRTPSDDS